MYSDQSFVLAVYGYKLTGQNTKGEDLFALVGRRSREFQFSNYGSSGQTLAWDVNTYELIAQ
ncbi:MAG: hypothetical protein AAB920_01545 [Patescibacteria group bacterium]